MQKLSSQYISNRRASPIVVPLEVAIAYTCPRRPVGIVTFPSTTGTKVVLSPFKNATNVGVIEPDTCTVAFCPGAVLVRLRVGKVLKGTTGFVDGHETIN
jgi:hypothetical protein